MQRQQPTKPKTTTNTTTSLALLFFGGRGGGGGLRVCEGLRVVAQGIVGLVRGGGNQWNGRGRNEDEVERGEKRKRKLTDSVSDLRGAFDGRGGGWGGAEEEE